MERLKMAYWSFTRMPSRMIILDFLVAVVLASLQTDPGIAIMFIFPIILFANYVGCYISVGRRPKNANRIR